jgi:hypothetical protein
LLLITHFKGSLFCIIIIKKNQSSNPKKSMKKIYLKWSGLSFLGALMLSSCMQETEAPAIAENLQLNSTVSSEISIENLRKNPNGVVYQEKFTNQIFEERDNEAVPFPAYYPGTGVGNATYIGKAFSFINQRAFIGETGPVTVGAPVSMFFSEELAELGITDLSDAVSSLTTDGKGNTVYFKNILNVTTPASETRINFVAEVEIIGGTGIFATAKGKGQVNGFFNPLNGEGETTLRANIVF